MVGSTATLQAQESFTVDNQVDHDLHRIYFYCMDAQDQAITYVFGPVYANTLITYALPDADYIKAIRIYCTPWEVIYYWDNDAFCALFPDDVNDMTQALKYNCGGDSYFFRGAWGDEAPVHCIDGGFLGITTEP
jgi:hypothetical protein